MIMQRIKLALILRSLALFFLDLLSTCQSISFCLLMPSVGEDQDSGLSNARTRDDWVQLQKILQHESMGQYVFYRLRLHEN